MRVDRASFRQLLRDKGDRLASIGDYKTYAQCCKDLNTAGRLCANEVIKCWGYARVVQALAATIIDYPHDYELPEIKLASQIPMPILPRQDHVRWHPAFVRAEFVRLVKLHLLEE